MVTISCDIIIREVKWRIWYHNFFFILAWWEHPSEVAATTTKHGVMKKFYFIFTMISHEEVWYFVPKVYIARKLDSFVYFFLSCWLVSKLLFIQHLELKKVYKLFFLNKKKRTSWEKMTEWHGTMSAKCISFYIDIIILFVRIIWNNEQRFTLS